MSVPTPRIRAFFRVLCITSVHGVCVILRNRVARPYYYIIFCATSHGCPFQVLYVCRGDGCDRGRSAAGCCTCGERLHTKTGSFKVVLKAINVLIPMLMFPKLRLLSCRLPTGAWRRRADRRDALQGAGRRVRAWEPRQHLWRQPLGLCGS